MFTLAPRSRLRPAITMGIFILTVLGLQQHRECIAQESRLVASPRAQAAEQRIREALRQPVSWNFHDMPLGKIIDELGRNLGINTQIDINSLKDSALILLRSPLRCGSKM